MDKRNQRMLEDLLKLPGNETCADCHALAPRRASVNLGIFLCVGCASVHRKMGTHKSRVKSVTLDTWSREHLVQLKQIGNKASNAIYNPNEKLHPPPTNAIHDERDSEIEKYIRRKYDGVFKARSPAPVTPLIGASGGAKGLPPAKKNPELNDVLVKNDLWASNRPVERDLPAIPPMSTPARARPVPGRSTSNVGGARGVGPNEGTLIDLTEGRSSTLPLQMGLASQPPFFQHLPQQQPQQPQQHQQPQPLNTHQPQQQYLGISPQPTNSFPQFSSSAPQSSISYNPFHQPQQLFSAQLQQQPQQSFLQAQSPHPFPLHLQSQPQPFFTQSQSQTQTPTQNQTQPQSQSQPFTPFQTYQTFPPQSTQTSQNQNQQQQQQQQQIYYSPNQSPFGQQQPMMGMGTGMGTYGGGYAGAQNQQGQWGWTR